MKTYISHNSKWVAVVAALSTAVCAQTQTVDLDFLRGQYSTNTVIIRVKSDVRPEQIAAVHLNGSRVRRSYPDGIQVVELPPGVEVSDAISLYQQTGLVEYAQPNYVYHAFATPTDPLFGYQWALNNTGQTGGTPDADIDAPEGWDVQSSAATIVVAVTDTGADLAHEDLTQNLWRNPGEDGKQSGIDDDGNGYVDDIHGINAINNSGSPVDDVGHGTHVSGIIGAPANNGHGVSGVCWQVKLMILKCLDNTIQSPSGFTANFIECLEYARLKGAHIVNASLGCSWYDQALYDKIAALKTAGIILVAAAGNDTLNNDQYLTFPACYKLDNIVSVAATDSDNALAYFSCFGYRSVALGAPGHDVVSTFFDPTDPSHKYENLSGTSMAAPHVAGALALLKARVPTDNYLATIHRLLVGVDRVPALESRVMSCGTLNLANALNAAVAASPANNNFAARQAVSGESTTVYGLNIGATKETGEPAHAGNSGGKSIWYSWTAPRSGMVEVTTAKSITTSGVSWNTLLAVYTGTSLPLLVLVASNNDSGIVDDGTATSRLLFNATAGSVYQIAVDGYNGAAGLVRLAIECAPPNDNLAAAYNLNGPTIAFSGTTLGASKEASEPSHAGQAGGRSLWWSWRAPKTGTVVLTTAGSTFDTILAVYTGSSYPLTLVASNDNDPSSTLKDHYGGLTSAVAFDAIAGTTYRIAVDGHNGQASYLALAGAYRHSVNTPTIAGTYPMTALAVDAAGTHTGRQRDDVGYLMTSWGQTTLGHLGAGWSKPSGFNASLEVVGSSAVLPQSAMHAFIWDSVNGMRRLDSLTYAMAACNINDAGLVAGGAWVMPFAPGYAVVPAYLQGGEWTQLPDLGGGSGIASDLNNFGEIVGYSFRTNDGQFFGDQHPAYWRLTEDGVETVDLGTLGGGSGLSSPNRPRRADSRNVFHPDEQVLCRAFR